MLAQPAKVKLSRFRTSLRGYDWCEGGESMKRVMTLVCVVVLAVACAQAASAQIIPGTKLTGNINSEFNSKSATVGERFTLTNVHSENSDITEAEIYGHVAHVQKAGQGTPGKIELAYDKLKTRSNTYTIEAHTTNVTVNTKSNATKEALAAAGGALVGGLIGKGWGAVIGGGSGYIYAKNNRQDVTIPGGSFVTVEITSSQRISK
jgi:hypothetical protein